MKDRPRQRATGVVPCVEIERRIARIKDGAATLAPRNGVRDAQRSVLDRKAPRPHQETKRSRSDARPSFRGGAVWRWGTAFSRGVRPRDARLVRLCIAPRDTVRDRASRAALRRGGVGACQPLMVSSGHVRATRRAMPASSTVWTTGVMSL